MPVCGTCPHDLDACPSVNRNPRLHATGISLRSGFRAQKQPAAGMAARLNAPTATERAVVPTPACAPQQMDLGAVARKARRKYAYLAARCLTQAGMLAMAAFAVSPSLMRWSIRVGPGAELHGLLMLGSLVVAAYALTSTLRKRWEGDGDPQQTG